jgi:hypothetical protein
MRFSVLDMRFAWLLIVLLTSSAAAAAETSGRDVPDPLVTRRMSAFYEVYTGRKLTTDERGALGKEFVEGHTQSGKSPEAIRAVAREFGVSMIVLREAPEQAAAASLRDRLLELNYFRREMQKTFELELLTEPDPVRITDARNQRLLTERDVVALANLHHFVKSEAAPRHREMSRQRIEELTALLKRSIAANSGTIPQFLGEVAAYWAGVRQHWPYFNTQQRNMARAYVNSTWRVSMPVEMYATLWGLDRTAAMKRWTADVSARIRGRSDGLGSTPQLRAALDSAFEP